MVTLQYSYMAMENARRYYKVDDSPSLNSGISRCHIWLPELVQAVCPVYPRFLVEQNKHRALEDQIPRLEFACCAFFGSVWFIF